VLIRTARALSRSRYYPAPAPHQWSAQNEVGEPMQLIVFLVVAALVSISYPGLLPG
jgi:hypothetical protein